MAIQFCLPIKVLFGLALRQTICTVTGDGACDTRRCHAALTRRQAAAIIPIRTSARPWKEDCLAAKVRQRKRPRPPDRRNHARDLKTARKGRSRLERRFCNNALRASRAVLLDVAV